MKRFMSTRTLPKITDFFFLHPVWDSQERIKARKTFDNETVYESLHNRWRQVNETKHSITLKYVERIFIVEPILNLQPYFAKRCEEIIYYTLQKYTDHSSISSNFW